MEDKFTWEEGKAFNFGLLLILTFSGLFFFMAFSQHDYKHVDKNFYHVQATFGRTDGLLVGDKVRMAGVDVGRVVDAKLDPNYNAILQLEIRDGLKIPDDSSASIVSSGLMGSKYIEIEPGGSEEFIPKGGEFSYTQDAMVLEELLDRIVAIGKAKHKEDSQCAAQKENISPNTLSEATESFLSNPVSSDSKISAHAPRYMIKQMENSSNGIVQQQNEH